LKIHQKKLFFFHFKKGREFCELKRSLWLLFTVMVLFTCFDIPYLQPIIFNNSKEFIESVEMDHEKQLMRINFNEKYEIYFFINFIVVYSLIPFFTLLLFNSLIISIMARQHRSLKSLAQLPARNTTNRERHFNERTLLLLLVSFFLVVTVTPRYIAFILKSENNILQKIFIILEMLNFSFNFFFYIIFSTTSRRELFQIVYYYFYWKWTDKVKTECICNHLSHNQQYHSQTNRNNSRRNRDPSPITSYDTSKVNKTFFSSSKRSHLPSGISYDDINNYNNNTANNTNKNRMKIHCFLIYLDRLNKSKMNIKKQNELITKTTTLL
jgi:hypothetical protein